jgi:hypothetical protein
MYLIKGTYGVKEQIESILSSIDLNKEMVLLFFNNWTDTMDNVDLIKYRTINNVTINRLKGYSKCILTDKYELMQWFVKKRFPQSLPCMVFFKYDESTIRSFLSRGSKHKFLKASDGFEGKGIKVIDSIKEVKEYIDLYKPTGNFQGWILQDALEDISTFQGYKFHLRVWIAAVVRNGSVSIYINSNHFYVFSKDVYDIQRIKEEDIFDSHKKRNTKNAFFPMERPDGWSVQETEQAVKQINKTFASIFKHHHAFLPDWKMKNGYDLLGADVMFDKKHNMSIIEINTKTGISKQSLICLPEVFHLGLGGAPLKFFTCLHGRSEGRITPFTKPLTTFYETQYKSVSEVNDAFQTLFHTKLEQEADRAYFEHQSYKLPSVRTTRKKHRSN